MRKALVPVLTLILLAALPSSGLDAQAPAEADAYAVAYVDVMPSGAGAAIQAMRRYREAGAAEPGFVRIDVFEQVGRPGHFAVVERWRDQKALEAHAGSASARQLREALQPVRVSGYDERPYRTFSVGAGGGSAGGTADAVHVVAHVDAVPTAQAEAPGLLRTLAETSRREAGNLRFDILQHTMRGNHYTVVESWRSQAALDAHAAAPHARQYREALQPISGSPLDQRVYKAVE